MSRVGEALTPSPVVCLSASSSPLPLAPHKGQSITVFHAPLPGRGECWTDSNNLCLTLGSEPKVSLLLRRGYIHGLPVHSFSYHSFFWHLMSSSFVYLFIHSFIEYFLSTHYMPGTVEEIGDTAVNKTGENLLLRGADSLVG